MLIVGFSIVMLNVVMPSDMAPWGATPRESSTNEKGRLTRQAG
jgi:hypothetical protein